ncbi:MAG: type II toxin-antitoxin system PemK/MazF family toxin [Actinobacteria bacterium]|nr:type II toxin-antitoxin system PemK/MazF family toxin [Actinomycetota bacterium]
MSEYPGRGQIWLVSLDPVTGSEIGKTRPALVISNNNNNKYAATITVIPLTSSTERVYPFEVFISKKYSGLAVDSKIKCNQVRTVDKSRLIKNTGLLPGDKMNEVEKALVLHLGIDLSGFIFS